jgi:predicted amidohydrolase
MRRLVKSEALRVGVIQMNSTADMEDNLMRAEDLLGEAAKKGARIAALPENFAYMGQDKDRAGHAQDFNGPILTFLKRIAREQSLILLGGSFLELSNEQHGKSFNTSVLIGPNGEIAGVYRKVHLFDVDLPGGPVYRESEYIQPGNEIIVCEVGGILFGLSICYDLRFPELYRRLSRKGARIIFVPSAFTLFTGKDHWFPLLQARAIENQVYILAPAQYGRHGDTRLTYGHSAIVDPWGIVLAQAHDRECVICAEYLPEYQEDIRRRLPVFSHLRNDLYPLA